VQKWASKLTPTPRTWTLEHNTFTTLLETNPCQTQHEAVNEKEPAQTKATWCAVPATSPAAFAAWPHAPEGCLSRRTPRFHRCPATGRAVRCERKAHTHTNIHTHTRTNTTHTHKHTPHASKHARHAPTKRTTHGLSLHAYALASPSATRPRAKCKVRKKRGKEQASHTIL
jgi:hypothetical protein